MGKLNNFISIIISTRNSEKYISKCLESAISQDYDNFQIIFIDADSTDGTYEIAESYTRKTNRLVVLKNETRRYQGQNIKIGTEMSPKNSIIVTLDGDDWFPHNKVLTKINSVYNEKNCWMTYGTYVEFPYRDVSNHYHEYPLEIRKNKKFREYKWLGSHLRTFRKELFMKIKTEDLIDPGTNDYFSMAPDLSFQFPMLEMCGEDKSTYISDILYVYNRENPLNEDKINLEEQERIAKFLRSKKPYETINDLYEQ